MSALITVNNKAKHFVFQKRMTPSLSREKTPSAISEAEALTLMAKGHDSMLAVLSGRSKNLQIVRALWTAGNTKVTSNIFDVMLNMYT